MLSQQIWTYDGLDAVEMIESQILLTSSHFDHTNSRYTDVDSHWAFRQYMPILMGKLFSEGGGEFVSSRILRYSVDKEKEESCPRNLLNSSFHLAKSPNDKLDEDRQSRSYKSFRPLANKGPAFEGYKVSESAAYLSDGVILRQLRGDTWLGGFARDHEAVARCGSTRVLGADNQVFTSGVKGLYMNYPSTGGFDLFFGAETSYADVQKTLNHAFDCGWVDQKTRAVMVIFTLTFFRDVELLDNGTPNSDNITWVKDAGDAASAYGPNIDVSVKIIFEMPSNGLVRSRHELAVIDKTQNTEKQICLFMIGITSILQVGLYVSDWCSMGTRSYWSHWNNILRLVSAFLAIGSLAAYFWSSFLNTIYAFDPGKVKAEASYAQYRCTALFDVEKNAEKTSMNVFLQTFSFHALLEVWSTLNYLNVFPKIMIPITALASSAREVLSFMCVFFLIIMGFTIAAHLTFGEIYEFRSVSQTFGTLLLISVDELDSVDLFDGTQHLQFGRIFIWIVRMTTSIIFLNIFIVIVLVQYEIARSENREVLEHMHQTLLTFGIRITSGFGGVVKRCSCICCCLKDPRNAQETYTTAFRKWYHGFRSSGHSDSYPPLRHDTEVVMGELHKLANELTIIRSIVVSQDAKILKLNAQLGQH